MQAISLASRLVRIINAVSGRLCVLYQHLFQQCLKINFALRPISGMLMSKALSFVQFRAAK